MTALLDDHGTAHEHAWRLEDVEFVEEVGQVSRFGCACGDVWFR
jgi:hypothetical protein